MVKAIVIVFLLLTPFKWIYVVDRGKCNGCGNCLSSCSEGAITMAGSDAYIDPELCNGCGNCVNYCPRDAIYREWYTGIEEDETASGALSFSQNPVTGSTVTIRGIEPLSEVKVTDLSGRILINGAGDGQGLMELDISAAPVGSYLVFSDEKVSVFTSI